MIRRLLLLFACLCLSDLCLPLVAQAPLPHPLDSAAAAPWHSTVAIGQYPASLGVPRFAPLHPGLRLGVSYQWRADPRHLVQAAHLTYFVHPGVQHIWQFATSLGYRFTWPGGFQLTPLEVGGGYQATLTDMPSVRFDPDQGRYLRAHTWRHNWLMILGGTVGYVLHGWRGRIRPSRAAPAPLTLTLSYRLQVHGPFVNDNVPLIAYTPLLLGLAIPW